jgi:hypothetical protein
MQGLEWVPRRAEGPTVAHRVARPEHITILPGGTRGDRALLERFLGSLVENTQRYDLIDVWFSIDRGDEAAMAVLEELRGRVPFGLSWVEVNPSLSNGAFLNEAWAACTTRPGIWGFISDKVEVRTRGWDELVRRAFRATPDGVLFAHGHDGHVDFGAFGFLGATWVNTLGRLFTDYFPYWFDDVWINEVANLIGRRVVLPIHFKMEVGFARHLHNALFWANFSAALFGERVDEALRLLAVIGPSAASRVEAIRAVAAKGGSLGRMPSEPWVSSERQRSLRLRGPNPRPAAGERVLRAEGLALEHLSRMLAVATWEGAAGRVEELERCVGFNTAFADHLYATGESARLREDRPLAVRCVNELIARFPNFPETWWLSIDLALQLGDVAGARHAGALSASVLPLEPGLVERRRRLAEEEAVAGKVFGTSAKQG